MLTYEEGADRIGVHVDPGCRDAWRQEPYYTQIQKWAANAAKDNSQVVVWEGPVAIVVLPGREKNLGELPPGYVIVTAQRQDPTGTEYNAIALPPDDPRLKRDGDSDG